MTTITLAVLLPSFLTPKVRGGGHDNTVRFCELMADHADVIRVSYASRLHRRVVALAARFLPARAASRLGRYVRRFILTPGTWLLVRDGLRPSKQVLSRLMPLVAESNCRLQELVAFDLAELGYTLTA